MPRKKRYTYRMSVALEQAQGEYLDYLVEKKWFGSQAQAIRWFIDYYQSHRDIDTVLPCIESVQTNKEAKE